MSYMRDDGDAPSVPGSGAAALADLRSTIKWLVASSGATAAALVGGLQITRLHSLTSLAGVISAVSAAVAIGLVLGFLTMAARVLATPRKTSTQISDLEINANAVDPDSLALVEDPLVDWVRQHGEHLLAGERTVTDLCSLKTTAQGVVGDLRHGRDTTWQGKPVTPGDTETEAQVRRVIREVDAALIVLEDAIHYHQSQKRFETLMKLFPWGGGLFVLAVLTFAIASTAS